ncbi:MAG TPA: TolC family protein [Bryobacteraceae bacterium]|nr:TolC family protein [Bryobacteraceae bacterium]
MPKLKIGLTFVCAAAIAAAAETHSLTLQQALSIAMRQNPEVVLTRLDVQRAQDDIRIAQNPFRPKLYGGSGLAYTYGYPNSIDGNAPSLFQAKTDMAIFDRPASYKVSAARELAHGAQFGAAAKAEEVAYQTADLFLSASQTEHESETLGKEIPSLNKVLETMNAAVREGSELPLEQKRAQVNLAVSQQRLEAATLDADYYEMMLATVLGFPATDRVKPMDAEMPVMTTPASESEASDIALRNNRELQQMQSNVLAKQLDLRSYKAERLPKIDAVAQYSLFAKQNYENYFQKFQHNNAQLGASITIPLLIGPQAKALADQAAIDMSKLRLQMMQVRNRIISDTRRSYQQWQKATTIRDLTRMQLDLARENLTVLLAQNGEGRVPLRDVEQARLEENDRWIALFDAETQLTRTKIAILRQMGTLVAALRGGSAPDTP